MMTETEQTLPPQAPILNLENLENLTDEEVEFLEDPVIALITKDVTKMSAEERIIHVKTLRELRTGQGGVKQLLSLEAESIREKKPRKKNDKKVDMSLVW